MSSTRSPKSPKNPIATAVADLLRIGVATIPIPELSTLAKRQAARAALDKAISNFPEYQKHYVQDGAWVFHKDKKTNAVKANKRKLVMGGFAALGNPSSFHNPFVRRWRMIVHSHTKDFMRRVVLHPDFPMSPRDKNTLRFAQEIDRLMVRPAGAQPSAESWHKDSSPLAPKQDLIFGGWLNLDEAHQGFSCVLPTDGKALVKDKDKDEDDDLRGRVGFEPIADKTFNKELSKQSTLIKVPPGHLLVFLDEIIHEVLSKKYDHVTQRLFMGWRLTHAKTPLCKDLAKKLDTMAAIPLKSNQEPPMYAALHWTNHSNALEKFSVEAFKDECLVWTKMMSTKKMVQHVPRYMPSLKKLGMAHVYPAYKPEEKALMRPALLFDGHDDAE